MNSQELAALLRMIGMIGGSYLTARGVASQADVESALRDMATVIPALISLGAFAYSVYGHWNMKKVPENSVAVAALPGAPSIVPMIQKGDHSDLGGQTVKVVGALLFALMLPALFSPAHSQIIPRATPLLHSRAGNAFLTTIREWISKDVADAQTLATSIPDLQDNIGATCWKTFASLGELMNNHPLPVTLKLASDVEAARLLQMGLKKVCAEPACAQVWSDMQNQIAALAPLQTPFTLNSICSKVL